MSVLAVIKPQLLPWLTAKRWVVAFSGGVDSVALLKAITELRQQLALPPIVALHIHHGLQLIAETWPNLCADIAKQLNVQFECISVQVSAEVASLEQAAREARYQGFLQFLTAGDVLLTGHHQDDQAETVLFRALRGAGVLGLSAMPVTRAIGKAQLVRPLLQLSKQQLMGYVQQHQLAWIDDPTNFADSYDRNFIRNQVLPLLESRWIKAQANLSRVAQHMAEAQALLDELAQQDIANASTQPAFDWLKLPCLNLASILQLSETRQKNALRFWLRPLTKMPDTDHWQGWLDLRDAAADAQPIWQLEGGQLVRYQTFIYWLPNHWLSETFLEQNEFIPNKYLLPNNGFVEIKGLPDLSSAQIFYRKGGEQLYITNRGHRDLKRLLQEVHLPHFLRNRIPLLTHQQQLVAVANFPQFNAEGYKQLEFNWHPLSALAAEN